MSAKRQLIKNKTILTRSPDTWSLALTLCPGCDNIPADQININSSVLWGVQLQGKDREAGENPERYRRCKRRGRTRRRKSVTGKLGRQSACRRR